MKKFISFILSLLVTFSLSISAFAVEFEDELVTRENLQSVIINEYDALKEAASHLPQMSSGYVTSEEIEILQNVDKFYSEHIKNLNTLDDETLTDCGYTDKQIEIIRNFTGSESELQAVGATVQLHATAYDFRFDGNRTKGRLSYNWSWSGVPAVKNTDLVAFSWNDWEIIAENSHISYYNTADRTELHGYGVASLIMPEGEEETEGAGHSFSVRMTSNQYYAKMGSGLFDIQSACFSQHDFSCYVEYGHATFGVTPAFAVGIPGSTASINFIYGHKRLDDCRVKFYF